MEYNICVCVVLNLINEGYNKRNKKYYFTKITIELK